MKNTPKTSAITFGIVGGFNLVAGFSFSEPVLIGLGFMALFPFLYFLNKVNAIKQ